MPKFYCEYCGVYLTHSSPSGRKQHCRDQNQSGILSSSGIKINPLNPFARPIFPTMPINIPGVIPNFQPNIPSLMTPHINLPGILPSNITSMPMMPPPGSFPNQPGMPPLGLMTNNPGINFPNPMNMHLQQGQMN